MGHFFALSSHISLHIVRFFAGLDLSLGGNLHRLNLFVALVDLRLFGLILDKDIVHPFDPGRHLLSEGPSQFLTDIIFHEFGPVGPFF